MAGETKQSIKHLKVDNWGVFFLQRLQLLFAKGDFCDLTLKFVEGQELKVHRLVLNTCTSYFESSQAHKNVIDLPETLTYSALQPIINFMYSGRLEFRPDLQIALLFTAKILKMDILVKLLQAQPKPDVVGGSGKSGGEMKKLSSPPTSSIVASTPTSTLSNMMAGKKLPIWRKRNLPLLRSSDVRHTSVEEDPRPTRFEWPGEDSSSILMSSPSFASISYESMPVLQSPVSPPLITNNKAIKRRVVPAAPPVQDKVQKLEENSGEGGAVRQEEEEDMSDDDDDGHFETLHNYDESDEENIPEASVNQLKPILKPTAESNNSAPSKKVRFSLENEDSENKKSPPSTPVLDALAPTNSEKTAPNHAKIIAEVLKKFPELVRNNKNIKLKITTPSPSSTKTTTFVIDSGKVNKIANKSSYVVVKAEKNATPSGTPERGNETLKTENTKGPWECKTCGNGETPQTFESYYLYRKHLQDVHLERIDSRVCEYCGFKASKRNLHLYHLYTKHNIAPPKNIKFPKCNLCSYIALSESLLLKHQNNHQSLKELTCQICSLVFKTNSSLQAHSVTCKPDNETRNFMCKYCKKYYRTHVGLSAHLKICQDKPKGVSETIYEDSETMEMIEVPVIETVGMEKGSTLLQLPTGIILAETPNMTLLPSSESDGLTNVASGIATSIGLTVALPEDQAVILLDENSEFFLEGNNSVVVSNNHAVEQYIVPEIMQDNVGHIYSTTASLPYTVSGTNVIAYPVMQGQGSGDQHQAVKRVNSEGKKDKTEMEQTGEGFSRDNITSVRTMEKCDKEESEPGREEKQVDKGSASQNKQTEIKTEEDTTKAKTIEGDWDFENDEEGSDISDDPELKPSRPTIDLQDLP